MSDRETTARSVPPRLPWSVTVALLVGVIVIALVRPFVPHGIIEFALRLAGCPLSLDIGGGKTVRFVEERSLKAGCQVSDVRWSPDGTTLVTSCSTVLQAWALDGHEIGRAQVEWPLQHMQMLVDPLRLAYLGLPHGSGFREPSLMVWNIQTDTSSALPVELSSMDNFVVDQDHHRVGLVHRAPPGWELALVSLEGGEVTQTLQLPSAAYMMRWLPGSGALLLGGYDGVLRRANIANGELRELARPYTISFPAGGGADGDVDGLVLAPDDKSVAIFKTSGGVTPIPGTGNFDMVAEKKWGEALGTTVEIRSIDDGRLLDRMPGQELGVRDLAWDPRDRFIVVAGSDAMFLWQRQAGTQALRTYDDPGIVHKICITDDGSRLALTTANGVRIFRIEEK